MSLPPRHTGEYDQTFAERVEELEREFRKRLREDGIRPSGDDRIGEEAAAMLIGFARGTVRNWRYADGGPRAFVIGRRITYRVRDLAEWLARSMREYWPAA